MELHTDTETTLRSLTAGDAAEVLAILDVDRQRFDPWLRWSSAVRTLPQADQFIADAAERERTGSGFHLGIWRGDTLVGGVACWSIDPVASVSEIGYWLAINARGNGLAFRASEAVIRYLFSKAGMATVELQCLVDNQPSRALAERLGGRLQAVRNQSCAAESPLRDHAVYVINRPDT